MARLFLTHARIDSFGAFANRMVGPFAPGLNVVFGRNEAGKSTLSAFVSGVLFGWEEARGRRNTYKPAAAERSGALFFAPRPEEAGETAASTDAADAGIPMLADERELYRGRNAEGVVGDASAIDDIDKETFRTMFSLTSDELRSLRNTSDVTAKLLTAGSGTGASPAHVFAELQDRIADRTARASGATSSLVNLSAQMDDLRSKIAAAEKEADRYKRESIELAEVAPQRAEMAARVSAVNDEISALAAARASVEKADAQLSDLEADRADVLEAMRADERASSEADAVALGDAEERLRGLLPSDEREIRDAIDGFAEERSRRDHVLEGARDTYAASKARYEALLESEDAAERARSAARQRAAQVVLSVVLPVAFAVIGILLFVRGRASASWSFTILGAAVVVAAVVLAGASIVLMFRPSKSDEEWEARKQDLRWTMLQDKKIYEQLQEEADRADDQVRAYLESVGLAAAEGSLRRARQMLDDAASARAANLAASQRRKAREVRLASLDDQIASIRAHRERACVEAGLASDATLSAVERALEKRETQRDELFEASARMERRCGELTTELGQAVNLHGFDELKLAYQQVRTRFDESAAELARLLVAKRMVERAIASWESASQPEVYRQASRLLSLMTDGRWVKIDLDQEGRLTVADAGGRSLDPVRLSLSTCQQLYLSMRIALLLAADNVGRNVPIVADDILVNFDADRRVAAAVALAELAKLRQVIMLTCHEEVVEAVRAADPSVRVIGL